MNKYNFFLLLFLFGFFNSFAQWTQLGQSIDGTSSGDGSGVSVAISEDGSIVAIGADSNNGIGFSSSGYVRVFENQAGTWNQLGQTLEGNGGFDQFGYTISLSDNGNFLAIASDSFSPSVSIPNRGKVQIFENQSGTWTQVGQDLEGEVAQDYFGFSISLSGDGTKIAIGAPFNDEGYMKVYENQSGTWTQIGQKIIGEVVGDQSGFMVSLSADGNTVAVGADSNDGNGSDSGHVRVYENQSGTWTQIGQDIDGENSDDFFGLSVSLSADGNIVAVGATGNDDNGSESGHVQIFENQSGSWTQIGQNIAGEAAGDQMGFSVSLSDNGNLVAIGANSNDGNGADAGHVRVYGNQSGTWVQIGVDIDGEDVADFSGQ